MARPIIWAAIIFVAATFIANAAAAQPSPEIRAKIVFVCLHGSVKSVVAAAHFNRIARERNLPYVAVARGIDRDEQIPAIVRNGLAGDGLAPEEETPRDLSADEASGAVAVIAFDPVPADRKGTAAITYWPGLPPVTKNYTAGRDAIVRQVEETAKYLPSNPETGQ